MKLKKLFGITLLAIPLYFFTPNAAKAEEFKINLKNYEVKTEKTNIVNDLDTMIMNLDFSDFIKKVNEMVENRIYEDHFLLDISPETRSYLFNWENATRHMNDMEKKFYMDNVDKDIKKIIKKEFRKEAQEEFRESRFYEWLKEELSYYKKRAKEDLSGKVKVQEKEAYITDEGGINLYFKESKLSVGHKKYLELNLKAKPFSFHSWDYSPKLELDIITKYFSIHNKASYSIEEGKLKTRASTRLPEGLILSLDYDRNKNDDANLTTKLSKKIKDYDLSLNYTRLHDGKANSKSSVIMFNIEKTW